MVSSHQSRIMWATTFKFSDILTGYNRILYFSYANISNSSPRNNSLAREACSLSISRQDTWVPVGIWIGLQNFLRGLNKKVQTGFSLPQLRSLSLSRFFTIRFSEKKLFFYMLMFRYSSVTRTGTVLLFTNWVHQSAPVTFVFDQ